MPGYGNAAFGGIMGNTLRPRQEMIFFQMMEHPIRHVWVDGMEIIAAVKPQVKMSNAP